MNVWVWKELWPSIYFYCISFYNRVIKIDWLIDMSSCSPLLSCSPVRLNLTPNQIAIWICRQKFGFFPNFLVQNFKLRFVLCTLNPCEPMGTLHQKFLPRPKIFTQTQNFHPNQKFSPPPKIFTRTQNFRPHLTFSPWPKIFTRTPKNAPTMYPWTHVPIT